MVSIDRRWAGVPGVRYPETVEAVRHVRDVPPPNSRCRDVNMAPGEHEGAEWVRLEDWWPGHFGSEWECRRWVRGCGLLVPRREGCMLYWARTELEAEWEDMQARMRAHARAWMSTQELAGLRHVAPCNARRWAQRLGIRQQEAGRVGVLWHRGDVERAMAGHAREVLSAVPLGWMLTEQAAALLGVGVERLYHWARRNPVPRREVVLRREGKPARVCVLWEVEGMERLRAVVEAARMAWAAGLRRLPRA